MKKAIAALIAFAAIAVSPLNAIAQTAPFNAPHRWTDTVTGKSYVFIPNQTPFSAITNFMSLNESGQESVRLDNCGWGKTGVDLSIVNLSRVGGGALDWINRTKGAVPSCTQNSSGAWVSSNPNAPVGAVVLNSGNAWIKGGNGWGSFSVIKDFGVKVTIKANACGFLKIALTATRTMKSFKVGGTSYAIATIPTVTKPMICRKIGANSIIYLPQ
jgi:hypothetical protein